tara:strand:- start:2448 stop:3137 length:690 start_codon:yes stop_codon:yes gene_type:complete
MSFIKNLKKKVHILQNIYIKNNFLLSKKTYSMEQEDIEILKYLNTVKKGFYVDVGAYHPIHLSNTFLLYKKQWRGINIDISSFSIDLFNYARPDDINLNIAISNKDELVTFYFQKKLSQLSTIKKDVAKERIQGEIKEKKIMSNKLTTILNKTKYNNRKIDFLNVDIEGADFEALKSLDFEIYRPKLICAEITDNEIENSEIFLFLKNLNYTKKWSGTCSHLFTDNYHY